MGYSSDVEARMKAFYDSLSEKDRRRYAAIEAEKLGWGGTDYIAGVLDGDPKTIRKGREDLGLLPDDPVGERVRKKGGTKVLS